MAAQTKGKQCLRCGSRDVLAQDAADAQVLVYVCMDCDHTFEVGGRVKEKFDKKRRRQGPEGSSPEFEGGMR